VAASDQRVGGGCHIWARRSTAAGGGNLWRSRCMTMKNGVLAVEYLYGSPQALDPDTGSSHSAVGDAPLRVDKECGDDLDLCGSVHNSHPLLPLLSFN
jgi:hypothetical protein